MTSEDDARTRLRVGGWLPPYQAFPPRADPLTPHDVYRSQSPADIDTTYELSAGFKNERRGSAVVFCAAVAGLLLIGITALQLGGAPATPAANSEVRLPAAPFLPPPPPYATPTPGAQPTSRSTRPARTRSELWRDPARTTSPAAAATTAATTTPTRRTEPAPSTGPGFRIGAAIGLELADAPGRRVRHRDFRGRSDRLGPESPALSRADARFVVRRGLADAGCVSFESSNYPGWFLRHRNFEIRLDRAERTRLFTADATFCPETRDGAGVVALRSYNYPDRFVTENRSLLRLTPATVGTATRFVVRNPL